MVRCDSCWGGAGAGQGREQELIRRYLAGVDGVDVVIGASSFLRKYSHGKDITYIIKTAVEVIEFVKSKGLEVRFSSEDSFRSDLVDLLSIYRAVDKIGVGRVGIADTVGCANPRQVYDLVRTLRGVVSCDIECHFHDDSGCGEWYIRGKRRRNGS